MSPSRPYLFKGLYDWILDNDDVPYIVVEANYPKTNVPLAHVKEGKITLSIHPSSVANFYTDSQCISFDARFGGKSVAVYIPIMAIKAIFAKHSSQGMVFGFEPGANSHTQPDTLHSHNTDVQGSSTKNTDKPRPKSASHLKLVK